MATHRSSALLLAAGLLLLSVTSTGAQSIYQVVAANANLTLLAAGLGTSGLASFLNDTALNITLFAPSDAALLAMTAELGTTPTALVALGPGLASVFQYHALSSPFTASAIPNGVTAVPTLLSSANLTVTKNSSSVVVRALGSDANVIQTDILAGGSVIHIIDKVLLPFYTSVASAATRRPELASLLSAVVSAGLGPTLSNPNLTVTVFAPINAAIDSAATYLSSVNASLAPVLTYHVVPARIFAANITATPAMVPTLNAAANLTAALTNGSVLITPVGATIAKVITADIPIGLNIPIDASPRSLIHIVDAALVPFFTTVANAAQKAGLNTLLAAVTASDAAFGTTVSDPNFVGTILAPSDAAFTRALADLKLNASQLLADKVTLRSILQAHIIPGAAVRSNQLTNGQNVTTMGGAVLTVNIAGSNVTFKAARSSANVVAADVLIGNGRAVVHVIDYVLLPAAAASAPPPAGGGGGGASAVAAPSSVLMLLSSAFAAVMLFAFGKGI